MDMRDKLFPIFIKETAKNLKILQDFLQVGGVSLQDPKPLETAFRAAHTLKGTARLVEVDAVHQIGRRIEALLEKHLTAKTRPTAVEHEALELAVGWLNHLLVELEAGRTGSAALVADALAALDLAKRFPGDTPLIELLDSAEQQRAPQLNDPFSTDPALVLDEEELLRTAKDPFADDPSFGIGFNFLPDPVEPLSKGSHSTRDEAPEPATDSVTVSAEGNLTLKAGDTDPAVVPYDPFADDLSFLDTETSAEVTEAVEALAGAGKAPAAMPPDPFAEDDYLDEDSATFAATEAAPVAAAESSADRVKELADWQLLPDEAAAPEHLYVCCCFELSGHNYYLPIEYVREIAETPSLLPLPLAPAPVCGLVNLRGLVLPVVDLASLDKHPHPQAYTGIQRLVVAEHQQEKLAFLADGIPYLSETLSGEKIDLPTFIQSHTLKEAEE